MEFGLEIRPGGRLFNPGTEDSIKEPHFQTLSLLYTYFGVIKLSHFVCYFFLIAGLSNGLHTLQMLALI